MSSGTGQSVSSAGTTVTPLPSATVLVARDSAAGVEVLLVQRRAGPAFGASFVFPGGLVDEADGRVAAHCAHGCNERAVHSLGLAAHALDYYSAAIRELFEETGVLLARTDAGRFADGQAFANERRELNAGTANWPAFLVASGLTLACDSLHYFAHWITPRTLGRRFTTRFFIAALPPGQVADHDGSEITNSCWRTPAAALDQHCAGQLPLPTPTRATLRELATQGSVRDLCAWAAQRECDGVAGILPAIVADADGDRIVFPGDADYPRDHAGAIE